MPFLCRGVFLSVLMPLFGQAQILGAIPSPLGLSDIAAAAKSVTSAASLAAFFNNIPLGTQPPTVADAMQRITAAVNASAGEPLTLAGLLRQSGIASLLDPAGEQLSGCGIPCTATNLGNPSVNASLYSQAAGDAPWSVPEERLRQALYIPPGFTHGRKIPVIMVPGTGNYGKQSFSANFGKKFASSNVADPVFLNVPGYLLDDAQTTAEYVAYAIKYIHALGQREVGLVTWSQGSVDVMWALQYWPSARALTQDVINLAGDYKGTPAANALCLLGVCQESVWQQTSGSTFVKTLRDGGGSSAYVPTTSIMSLTDNMAPQLGGSSATGYLDDVRGVGVTNVFIQEACALQPGGIPYTHEGTMFSNLAYDLAIDALSHDGPGKLERLDLQKTCSFPAIEGLTVLDIIYTEGATPQAFYNILTTPPAAGEPPIRAYARK